MTDHQATTRPDGDVRVGDTSLATVVYADILQMIHRQDLKPGDWVTESEFANRLGVSRSPVREAFAQLVNQGLLVRVPRRGNYVAVLEQEHVANLRDCRQLIEGYAARTLACRLSKEQSDALEALINQMVASAQERDWIQTVYLNSQFHETVVKASGNTILHRMWVSVDPLAWLVAATKEPGHEHDPRDLEKRHRLLLNALKSGDPDEAEKAFRLHVAESLVEAE